MPEGVNQTAEIERLRAEVARLNAALKGQSESSRISEDRLSFLIDHLPIGMVYQLKIDSNGKRQFTYISGSVERNHGLTPQQVYADATILYRQIDPQDLARMYELEMASAKECSVFSTEARYHMPGGEQRWALLRSAPRRQPDGSVIWDGVEFDITERKRAEELLRENERELQTMVRAAPVGICRVRNRVFLRVNDVMTDLFGYTQEEFIGMPTRCLYATDEEYKRVGTFVYSDLHKEGFMSVEVLCVRKDGKPIFINLRSALFNSEDENAGYISMVLDITERKRQEEALRLNERRLAYAVGATADAIWEWDVATNQLYYSPRWYEMLGYKSGEIDTKLDAAINLIHPDDAAQIATGFQQALGPEGIPVHIELRMRHKDGRWIWILVRGNAVERDAQGRSSLISGTNTDITERRAAEAERNRLRDQLEQAMKMEAVGQLAGGIAHDFNNLITVITGNVELARLRLAAQPEVGHYIDEIQRASERAASLTRQLLAFSRRQIIEPQVLNLNELVSNVQRMLLRLIGENIEMQAVFEPDANRVKVDPGQFEQVLVNLAVNARDAMPSGGKLLIETRNILLDDSYCVEHPECKPGRHVMLAVSDTGEGMTEEIRKRIFEPFFTTKGVGKGTGLGLSMVFGAVKQANGSIEVYSEPGKGTTFKIYLPCQEHKSVSTPREVPVLELLAGTETLLFVEDEASVREVALIVLRQQGYQVLEARNGAEAMKIAGEYAGRIDLLLTDVVMPGKNGREVAEEIRKQRPEINVLFTSGYTENVIVHHGVLDSNINFIGKPYSPQTLTRKIRDVLGNGKK